MAKTYECDLIANELLSLSARDTAPLTVMKLLKLVYIAHGWYLAFADKPLISEKVEAWDYGPVRASAY
jgi:uncharacterized phage-associated protein